MAERPDLRRHAAAVRERVVARHRAVLVEPHDLAEVGIHVLRRIELLAIAGADPQMAAAERDAVAVVAAAVDLRRLPPDDLQVLQLAAVGGERELGARDGGAARFAFTGFGIAQIHEPVVREVGMQHDVAQPALAEPS